MRCAWQAVGLVATVLLIVSLAQAQPVQWASNGHYYEGIAVSPSVTWADAQADALSRGGYLATITSAEENDFVFNLIKDRSDMWSATGSDGQGPWIGGLQAPGSTEPDQGWEWVTGEAWGYTNWAAGQPDDYQGTQDSLHFFGDGVSRAATWDDDHSYIVWPGYVVEYVPEPASLGLLALSGIALVRRRR